MDFCKTALSYRERGYLVIPIIPKEKKPLVDWKKFQTKKMSNSQIMEWWETWPDANLGIITGAKSGVVVIDCDSSDSVRQINKILRGYDLSSIPQVKTGKGVHFYFKHPGCKVPSRAGIQPGLDVRGDGGFVVAPPSIHSSGKKYKWKVSLNGGLPQLPPELYKLITSPIVGGKRKNLPSIIEGKISEGKRNATLTSLAGSMRAQGFTFEPILAALLEINKTCSPPLPESEVESIAKSITRYEPGEAKRGADSQNLPSELAGRSIHPAIHIEPDFQSVGIVTRENTKLVYKIITANGNSHLAENIKGALLVEPDIAPLLSGRWQSSGKPLTLSKSVALLEKKMQDLICFENKRWYSALSVWAAGTYLFPAFGSYPYLQLTGEKGSGKTKLQDIFECVTFNAFKMVGVTPAVLFRIIHALRPTLLIDEAEKMNTDQAGEIRAIINAGYKLGAMVPRCVGDDYHIKHFDVYSPKCLAGINGLGDVTEDRCITVVMARPPYSDTRQNIPVDPKDPAWGKIREGFYRLPFNYASKVMDNFDNSKLPRWLTAREKELWEPLLRIAAIVDEERGKTTLFDSLLALAEKSVKARGLSFETDELLEILESELDGEESMKIYPGELAKKLKDTLDRKVTSQQAGENLRSLGIERYQRSKRGVVYEVKRAKLQDIRERYAVPPE